MNVLAIQWTGDNIEEMIKFEPSVYQVQQFYPDWPGINILKFNHGGVPRTLKMRDFLIKSGDNIYVSSDLYSSTISLKEMISNGKNSKSSSSKSRKGARSIP